MRYLLTTHRPSGTILYYAGQAGGILHQPESTPRLVEWDNKVSEHKAYPADARTQFWFVLTDVPTGKPLYAKCIETILTPLSSPIPTYAPPTITIYAVTQIPPVLLEWIDPEHYTNLAWVVKVPNTLESAEVPPIVYYEGKGLFGYWLGTIGLMDFTLYCYGSQAKYTKES